MEHLTLADYCATAHSELTEQWAESKNGILTPADVTVGSHQKVWWRCEKGHEWYAEVKSRVNGANCPVCTNKTVIQGINDLATTMPELAKQWDRKKKRSAYPRNRYGGRTPQGVVALCVRAFVAGIDFFTHGWNRLPRVRRQGG